MAKTDVSAWGAVRPMARRLTLRKRRNQKQKIIALAAALAATPAGARIVEVHDIWLMNCFPQNAAPFVVGVSGSSNQLAIKSKHGPFRSGRVISRRLEGHGITVLAQGQDYAGYARTLQAHFGPSGGFLDAIDRTDPAIQCGPDWAGSND